MAGKKPGRPRGRPRGHPNYEKVTQKAERPKGGLEGVALPDGVVVTAADIDGGIDPLPPLFPDDAADDADAEEITEHEEELLEGSPTSWHPDDNQIDDGQEAAVEMDGEYEVVPAPAEPLIVPEVPEIRTYECKCGFTTNSQKDFRNHFITRARAEPGLHKSLRKQATAAGRALTALGKSLEHIQGASRIRFIPKEFVLEASPILFQAMEVAVNEWGWPSDMSPQDFLDTYLYRTMQEKGIEIHGYVVKDHQGGSDDSKSIPAPVGVGG